jgi:hypothetical protein
MAQHPDLLREIDIVLRAFEVKYYISRFLVFPPASEGRRLDVQP